MLIVLRGNSGSGKTTTAKLLRETALERRSVRKIALVEQDYLRRIVLKEKESEGSDNIDLIFQTVAFALQHDYAVILEGILYSKRYHSMLTKLRALDSDSHCYYFDVSLEETLQRHQLKPDAHEFGEKELRAWYREKDLLGVPGEVILPEHLNQQQILTRILAETSL